MTSMTKTYLGVAAICVITFALAYKINRPTPQMFYLPDAAQGSQPVCLSNHARGDLQVANGPLLHPGESVEASVVEDFNWGFTNPTRATDRHDVDCFVIEAQ